MFRRRKSSVAVAVVLKSDGEGLSVLALKRKADEHECPRWVFPGGKIENGEDPCEAALRELHEETGLAVHHASLLGNRRHPMTGVMIRYVGCDAASPSVENREPEKADELRWVPVNELSDVLGGSIFPKVHKFIEDRLQRSFAI